jgi:hypothetical protein
MSRNTLKGEPGSDADPLGSIGMLSREMTIIDEEAMSGRAGKRMAEKAYGVPNGLKQLGGRELPPGRARVGRTEA